MTMGYRSPLERQYIIGLGAVLVLATGCSTKPQRQKGDGTVVPCTTAEDCSPNEHCQLGICAGGAFESTDPGVPANGSDGGDRSVGDGSDGDDPSPDDGTGCDCFGLQLCDDVQQTCVSPDICIYDEDCATHAVCDRGVCDDESQGICDPSTGNNRGCPRGRVCEEHGHCVFCVDATGCDGNQECVDGSCIEPDHCTSSSDCMGGATCFEPGADTGTCAGPFSEADCFDDGYRTATSENTAASLPATGDMALVLCGADKRFVAVPITGGDGLVARLSYPSGHLTDPTRASLRIYQTIDDSFEVLAETNLVTDNRAVIGVPSTLGEGSINLYVAVESADAFELPVGLSARVVPGGYCIVDELEDNDTSATAFDVGFEPNNRTYELTVCGDDDDWFVATIGAQTTLTVTMYPDANALTPAAELYEGNPAANHARKLRDASDSSPKVLTYKNVSGETKDYYIRIFTNDPQTRTSAQVRLHTF